MGPPLQVGVPGVTELFVILLVLMVGIVPLVLVGVAIYIFATSRENTDAPETPETDDDA